MITARISQDVTLFKTGTGLKLNMLFFSLSQLLSGVLVGLLVGWQLALVVMAMTPISNKAMAYMMKNMGISAMKQQNAYAEAASRVEESLQAIRTVVGFSRQEYEIEQYSKALQPAFEAGIEGERVKGVSMGGMSGTVYLLYAISLWFGALLIRLEVENHFYGRPWTGGDVATAFFTIIVGTGSLPHIGMCTQAVAESRAAATRLLEVIERKPKISSSSSFSSSASPPSTASTSALSPTPSLSTTLDNEEEEKLQNKVDPAQDRIGMVEFKGVHFTYPTREKDEVLRGLSFSIQQGSTVALVGQSGGGKSTVIQLLERFYDPTEGSISVDGTDLRSLDLLWWRRKVSLVSQNPILFSGTVLDNIRYGCGKDVSLEEVQEAAKSAHAHDFILDLPQGYDTFVGEEGQQLSGGQRQRIAIARAIVRNPSILLLDEATSALDNESERIVQKAIDSLTASRTCVVVAHRLSTIRNADVIHVLKDGRVAESGSYDELLADQQSLFHTMVQAQSVESKVREGREEKDGDDLAPGTLSRYVSGSSATSATSAGGDVAKNIGGGKARMVKGDVPEDGPVTDSADSPTKESIPHTSPLLVMPYLRGSWAILIGSIISGIILGGVKPLWGFAFGNMIGVLYEEDESKQERDSYIYASVFIGAGVGVMLFSFTNFWGLGIVGERTTMMLRQNAYRSMLNKEMAWHDLEQNNTRVLASRLQADTTKVHNVRIGFCPIAVVF